METKQTVLEKLADKYTKTVAQLSLVLAVAFASVHHFGWEGIGVMGAVLLLMPYEPKGDF